jgi:hypothetical protein
VRRSWFTKTCRLCAAARDYRPSLSATRPKAICPHFVMSLTVLTLLAITAQQLMGVSAQTVITIATCLFGWSCVNLWSRSKSDLYRPCIMLHRALCLCLHFLPFFTPFTLARADYIMDDTNSSITYLPPGFWIIEHLGYPYNIYLLNGTIANIDYTQLYNQTL